MIQLDLEDAIAPQEKDRARADAPDAIARIHDSGRVGTVRVNGPLRLLIPDLESVVRPGLAGLTIPKVHSSDYLKLIDETLTELELEREIPEGSVRLIAQIETAEGLMHLEEIARSTPRLAALSVGPEDLAADLGSAVDPDVMYVPNMQALIAARAAGVIPLGYVGSITLYDDPDTYRGWVRRARNMGFEGAFCIHPNQVEILNEEFVPEAEEVKRAAAVVAAFEEHVAAGTGAFAFEGRMVDAPVINRARRLLKRSNKLA